LAHPVSGAAAITTVSRQSAARYVRLVAMLVLPP